MRITILSIKSRNKARTVSRGHGQRWAVSRGPHAEGCSERIYETHTEPKHTCLTEQSLHLPHLSLPHFLQTIVSKPATVKTSEGAQNSFCKPNKLSLFKWKETLCILSFFFSTQQQVVRNGDPKGHMVQHKGSHILLYTVRVEK